MKFKGFEELDMTKQSEETGSETKDSAPAAEKPAAKIDRRPAAARPKAVRENMTPEEERDERILKGTADRLLDETGHIPDQKKVYDEALRWKFQGMPYEMFADKLVEAFMKDEDLAKKVQDAANKELADEAYKERTAKFGKLTNKELAAAAVFAAAHDPEIAEQVAKRFNQSSESRRKEQERREKSGRMVAFKTVVDPLLKKKDDGSERAA